MPKNTQHRIFIAASLDGPIKHGKGWKAPGSIQQIVSDLGAANASPMRAYIEQRDAQYDNTYK
jgi:hypothetical protein